MASQLWLPPSWEFLFSVATKQNVSENKYQDAFTLAVATEVPAL